MDKQRKRALKQAVRKARRADLAASLPTDPETMAGLFDFLDDQLSEGQCEHNLGLTRRWCQSKGIDEPAVVAWAESHGGFCDCEVLANCEQVFEEAVQQ